MFLGKGVLKICNKFTGDHPCRSVILIKLLYNFIEITLRHGCSPRNLLHIFMKTVVLCCLYNVKNKSRIKRPALPIPSLKGCTQ